MNLAFPRIRSRWGVGLALALTLTLGATPLSRAEQATGGPGSKGPTVSLNSIREVFGQIGSETIWVDQSELRTYMAALRPWMGDQAATLAKHLLGIRLNRSGDTLEVGIYLDQTMEIPVHDSGAANPDEHKIGALESIYLPRAIRFGVQFKGD